MVLSETFGIVLFIGIFGAISALLKKSVLYILNPTEFLMLTFLFEFLFMVIFLAFSGDINKHFKKISISNNKNVSSIEIKCCTRCMEPF